MAGRADSVMAQDFLTDVDAPALLGRLKAAVYRGLLAVCLAQPACKNFETWGFTDQYTWLGSDQRPLPFDQQMKPKPAFDAMLAELRGHATRAAAA